MKLKILRTEEEWNEISEEWNELLEKSISDLPFLRSEYLAVWWQFCGGGEWPNGELYIITGRDQADELVGAAPFFLTENKEGKPALLLLGSVEISDFLDIIVQESDHKEFLSAILDHLTGEEAPEWEIIDLYNLLEESPTLDVIEQQAKKHSLSFSSERLQPSPYIPLPNDFDEYLTSIEKKYRHEFRRKLRNAAGFFIPVTWYTVEDEAVLDDELDVFFELMREEKEKRAFLTEEMTEQMKAIAHAFFKMGILRLSFIKVGNDYAGGYFNLVYKNRVWVYNSGMGAKFSNLSPGIVLTGYLLMDAIEKGFEVFDMMRGDEEYKYHLGGVDRYIMRAQIKK
ncbi:MAG: GNAT family N-acetyltransferase [Chloroflexi bacterium]|nr:GNAT family N-acetyltransferase [Chloroflexota bacterium]MBT3671124.1 GNAT family N-acetyltransferase [Chloroflexota bacterium]MBT4004395.1 GNAT family N-acetyltransferase [Chloroflexota bacterium]MBT4304417.1 GNAT family N-acetyltransferase [Chloroflexota bacterium]MBT4534436.1 GNAT family N-acetyltransferase [Chloroflexota bacterium]